MFNSDIIKILSVLSGVVFVTGFVPYALAIYGKKITLKLKITSREKISPKKASWIVWLTIDIIALVGMVVKESLNGQIVGIVSGGLIVLVLTLINGEHGWTKLDKWCIALAGIGIISSLVFWEANIGIGAALLAGFIGSFPTFNSAWKKPSNEDKLGWTLFWTSCVLAVIAIPKWTFEDAAQPIVFFTIESIMMFILFIRPILIPIKTKE